MKTVTRFSPCKKLNLNGRWTGIWRNMERRKWEERKGKDRKIKERKKIGWRGKERKRNGKKKEWKGNRGINEA